MVVYFIGGVLGSAMAGSLYSSGGWGRICLLGALTGAATLSVAVVWRARPTPMATEKAA